MKMIQNIKNQSIDKSFTFFSNHPYVSVVFLSLLLLPFGFAQRHNITTIKIIIEAFIMIFSSSFIFIVGKPSHNMVINKRLAASTAILFAVFFLLVKYNTAFSVMLFIPVIIAIMQLSIVLHIEKKLTTERIVILLIIIGIVIRYCYCLRFNCLEMQHDIGKFKSHFGHLSYINYWYTNGLKLPDFDVRTQWQYYHPPLHHILMAIVLRILIAVGFSLETAIEAIQILPMIYSSFIMIICYKLFKLVKLNGIGLIIAMFIICTYPTFIIWSGSYNNDTLCTMFMLLSVLCALRWYQNPSMSKIIHIALCIGLGMMTKLSAWMIAPAIALLFIWTLIKNIKKPLDLILQYFVFGLISIPLGLWWGIRNLIKFNVPITYIPNSAKTFMHVDNIPVLKRLFDFSFSQFNYPFEAFDNHHAPYNEYNPLIALIKTSVFDEYYSTSTIIYNISRIVVIFVFVLFIISLIGVIYMLFSKKALSDLPTKLFFLTIIVTITVSYYIFCFKFPYVCTENIRYCIPLIPVLALGLGFLINKLFKKI